ncbi:MAG: hypothetical protein H0W67_03475 [Gemmatimonadales bacterium]|nr:hypothetical protein [Gemmatimonadales bacterium]
MSAHVLSGLVLSGLVLAGVLAGCGSATSTAPAGTPAPSRPGESATTNRGTPAPRGDAYHYRPTKSVRYTLNRHDSLDLQLPGGASQVQVVDRTAFLRVSLAEASGGFQAMIVLDSLRGTSGGQPLPSDSLYLASGTRWTAQLSPAGRLSGVRADKASSLGDQVASSLPLLFPTLPAGGARAGMQWSDSAQAPVKADAFDVTEQLVTHTRAVEGEEPGGTRALRLESAARYARSGTGKQADQTLEMTSSGARLGVAYLGRDGTLLAAEGSDSGNMTITVPAVGQTVPVKQSARYRIRKQ